MGIGFDIHPLVENRPLILGGVEIPHSKGLKGHSDADVLSHAICDALLGACGEGDIGEHFPDSDPTYRGVSSLALLEKTLSHIQQKGFEVVHVDTIIIAEEPKLTPHKPAIQKRLAKAMHLSEAQVNIKAKRTEGLGFLGDKKGIASYAVVSVTPKTI